MKNIRFVQGYFSDEGRYSLGLQRPAFSYRSQDQHYPFLDKTRRYLRDNELLLVRVSSSPNFLKQLALINEKMLVGGNWLLTGH
jgi:hypothetical protein